MDRVKSVKITKVRDRYRVDYRDPWGKRHRPSFATMAEAQEHERLVLSKPRLPVANVQPHVEYTIKKSIQQYRSVTSLNRIGQTATNEKYSFQDIWDFLRNKIEIEFVHEIEQIHFEMFRAHESARGLKNSSIKRKENAYRAWLSKCVSWGAIAKHPMKNLKPLSEDTPNIKTWSPDQVTDAILRSPIWLKRVLFFLERTGRRPIDAARATFGDVDEAKKTIRVKSYKGGKVREIFVPLSDDLFEMIVNIRAKEKMKFRGRNDDFIFLNAKQKPVTTNAIGLALRKAGITEVTAYGLRHSFINGLVDDGIHERDVQLLAGHAKFETTTRYTHRRTEHLRGASQKRAEKVRVKVSV